MQAYVAIDEAARLLSDVGNDKWPRNHLAHAVAFVLREIAGLRPYSLAELDTMELDSGYEHAVPDDVLRWLGAVRNMGSDGSTPGRTIVSGDWHTLKAFDPDLYGRKPGSEVREVYWDESKPRVFYTYPPVTSGVHIQFQAAKAPPTGDTIAADDTTDMPITADYLPALVDGVMAYALGEQIGRASQRSAQESAVYTERFYQALNVDRRVKRIIEPHEQRGGQ